MWQFRLPFNQSEVWLNGNNSKSSIFMGGAITLSLKSLYNLCNELLNQVWGLRGLMVMALDCGAGGLEFKPPVSKNIFDLMERFDETV